MFESHRRYHQKLCNADMCCTVFLCLFLRITRISPSSKFYLCLLAPHLPLPCTKRAQNALLALSFFGFFLVFLNYPASISPICSAATRSCIPSECTYRIVVCTSLCPIIACVTLMEVPLCASIVAYIWQNTCAAAPYKSICLPSGMVFIASKLYHKEEELAPPSAPIPLLLLALFHSPFYLLNNLRFAGLMLSAWAQS